MKFLYFWYKKFLKLFYCILRKMVILLFYFIVYFNFAISLF